MSHLGPLARTLVGIWLVVWLGFLTLYVSQAARGRVAWHPILVDAPTTPDGYPTVGRFEVDARPLVFGDPAPEVGDRVLRVGGADSRGFGPLRFDATSFEHTGPDLRVSLTLERESRSFATWMQALPLALPWKFPLVSFSLAGVGVALALRASGSRSGRLLAASGMIQALTWVMVFGAGPAEWHYAWVGMRILAAGLAMPVLLTALLFFPDDRLPGPPWLLLLPWIFALSAFVTAGIYTGQPLSPKLAVSVGVAERIVATIAVLGVVTWKYRRTTAVGRRKIKWVVYGFYLALLPRLAAELLILTGIDPYWRIQGWAEAATVFIPLSLLIAIVRFNLFDIDRLISGAAAYTVVGIALLAGLLTALPPVAGVISDWAGIETELSQVVLALVVAGIAIPVAERLRPHLDRVLFADRYRFEQSIGRLIERLAQAREPRELIGLAGQELTDLLRPESCVVYAVVGRSYAPVFAEGRAVPPAFEADSPLIGTLRGRRAPLSLSDAGRRPDEASLGPFDRAALETLGAEVVVPVRQGDTLAAFVCLGPKRSGDVYTSTDLSLLAAVAEKVSTELRRFDQDEVIREAQAMQESLRRYVPGAIAEQLASGGDLASGEREVTVLFVDIRGYTGFAESRKAEEIFSTVNRYTETVSRIVQEHGGSVVGFNGDGMTAVFGAPRELAHKERAAVEAGCEIVEAVAAVPVEGEDTKLSVGVGIATGEAFVGNIQAVDRMIWSAIGNTTNLAARLQSLTRELDASLAIDATTQERAEAAAAGFDKRSEVPIRGRREAQDVYALPMRENPGRLS